MRKPDQKLDDYIAPSRKVIPEPPRWVSLRRTGEFEVLRPLTHMKGSAKPKRHAFKAPFQPLWFRRFLAVGSGALVLVAFALISAILVGMNDAEVGPEVATIGKPDDTAVQTQELYTFDLSSTAEPATDAFKFVRSNTRRRSSRLVIPVATNNKPRRHSRPAPRPQQPRFVPTTLVIYAENGVINTRVEPWLQGGSKPTSND